MAVIGGGAVGLTVGWKAAARGLRVVVLERGEPGHGTSWVAAGMLAPVAEARLVEQSLLQLGLAAAERYPRFVEDLSRAAGADVGYAGASVDSTGADVGYLSCGTLLVARDRDEAEALERELELRRDLGLAVDRLRPSQARALEPALAPTVRLALEVPGDHAIDPRKLTAALAVAFMRAGGELRVGAEADAVELRMADEVEAEEPPPADRTMRREFHIWNQGRKVPPPAGEPLRGGLESTPSARIEGIRLSGGDLIHAEQIVIAAGAWSDEVGGIPNEARVPIHPVKGQILRLHDPAGPGLLTRVLRIAGGYIVPRGDGRYALGATMEERGFDTTATAGAAFELLRDAIELVPGVSELVIDELGAGLRPATADNSPAIGPGAIPGLHWAVGHHRNGILLAPITAELVVAGLLGEEPPPVASPFAPGRFTRVEAAV